MFRCHSNQDTINGEADRLVGGPHIVNQRGLMHEMGRGLMHEIGRGLMHVIGKAIGLMHEKGRRQGRRQGRRLGRRLGRRQGRRLGRRLLHRDSPFLQRDSEAPLAFNLLDGEHWKDIRWQGLIYDVCQSLAHAWSKFPIGVVYEIGLNLNFFRSPRSLVSAAKLMCYHMRLGEEFSGMVCNPGQGIQLLTESLTCVIYVVTLGSSLKVD